MSEIKEELDKIISSEGGGQNSEERDSEIRAFLKERKFDFSNPPVRPKPSITLESHTIATPGNLINIQAGVKVGKSAVVGVIGASMMKDAEVETDCFGFESTNESHHAVIHLDTEQSRCDADTLIRRSIERAMKSSEPEWFSSFSIPDLDPDKRRRSIELLVEDESKKRSGVFAVIIDGVADLIDDPNDAESSFALVAQLQSLAIAYDCVIITVLHENPNSETGKTRGHLGSQLERKAETNLRLWQDKEGVTTIYTAKSRHCYIPKKEGPCFKWNDDLQIHVSCGTEQARKEQADFDDLSLSASIAFAEKGEDELSYNDLVKAIMATRAVKDRSAKTWVKKFCDAGILLKDKDSGAYSLKSA